MVVGTLGAEVGVEEEEEKVKEGEEEGNKAVDRDKSVYLN